MPTDTATEPKPDARARDPEAPDPTALERLDGVRYELLPLDLLIPTSANKRQVDPESPGIADLTASIRAMGVQVPVHVRAHPNEPGRYELLAGERRFVASWLAGLEVIPALVHVAMSDADAADLTAIENLDREDLAPFEECETVLELVKRHGSTAAVAERLGKPPRWVVTRARLRALEPIWRDTWANARDDDDEPIWTTRHMEIIARLSPENQQRLHPEWGHARRTGLPSTRRLQEWIDSELHHRLRAAPWPMRGSRCATCPHRTDADGEALLHHDPDEDLAKNVRCTDPDCWAERVREYVAAQRDRYRAESPDLRLVSEQSWLRSEQRDALREEHGGPVLAADSYIPAKPQRPGAVRALLVDGPRAGKRIWITPYLPNASASTDPDAGKPAPKPLAERRAALDRKRWGHAIEALTEQVKRVAFADLPTAIACHDDLAALAAAFGTNHCNDSAGPFEDWNDRWPDHRVEATSYVALVDPWALYHDWTVCSPREALASGYDAALEQLWFSIRAVLTRRLRWHGGATQVTDAVIEEAQAIAALLHLDLDAYRAQAAAALPEPKSWAKLNEDGTPKRADDNGGGGPRINADERGSGDDDDNPDVPTEEAGD